MPRKGARRRRPQGSSAPSMEQDMPAPPSGQGGDRVDGRGRNMGAGAQEQNSNRMGMGAVPDEEAFI